jgi:AAA domain-containing protein
VESEKAALAITAAARKSHKLLAPVALGGCYGWRGKAAPPLGGSAEAGTAPLRDLELFRNKKIVILLDANVATNPHVKQAETELAAHLALTLGADVKVARIPPLEEVNGPDDYLVKVGEKLLWEVLDSAGDPWADLFASYEKIVSSSSPSFAIKNFLQLDTATFVAGLPGHSKTWVLLSMVRSLLEGTPLFGYFNVLHKAERVIYLTPEVSLNLLYKRLKLFKLDLYLKDGRLLVRTLSEGPTPELTHPDLLMAARGSHVFLDTAIRFMAGDENQSIENQRGLATGIFGLLHRGARSVVGAHHAPKAFERAQNMNLENMMRGSGDIGAMVGAAWGIRLLDPMKNRGSSGKPQSSRF